MCTDKDARMFAYRGKLREPCLVEKAMHMMLEVLIWQLFL